MHSRNQKPWDNEDTRTRKDLTKNPAASWHPSMDFLTKTPVSASLNLYFQSKSLFSMAEAVGYLTTFDAIGHGCPVPRERRTAGRRKGSRMGVLRCRDSACVDLMAAAWKRPNRRDNIDILSIQQMSVRSDEIGAWQESQKPEDQK